MIEIEIGTAIILLCWFGFLVAFYFLRKDANMKKVKWFRNFHVIYIRPKVLVCERYHLIDPTIYETLRHYSNYYEDYAKFPLNHPGKLNQLVPHSIIEQLKTDLLKAASQCVEIK